jgi:phage tail P2-like protein
VDSFSFNNLLPHSIKDDQKFKAASQCLDDLFSNFNKRVKELLIYSRIDELDEQMLDDLAWQWNIDYDDGYRFITNIQEKRDIVKSALQLHKYRGTRWSIDKIGDILNMPIEIIEWWQSEYAIGLEPYEFDAFVDANQRGVSEQFYIDVGKLINSLKNVRSHLRKIQAIISINDNFYLGSACVAGNIGNVFPELLRKLDANMPKYLGVVGCRTEISYVLPELLRILVSDFEKYTVAIGYRVDVLSVYPAKDFHLTKGE